MTEKEALENHLDLCLKLLMELECMDRNEIVWSFRSLKLEVDKNLFELRGKCYLCNYYECFNCPLISIKCVPNYGATVSEVEDLVKTAFMLALNRYGSIIRREK